MRDRYRGDGNTSPDAPSSPLRYVLIGLAISVPAAAILVGLIASLIAFQASAKREQKAAEEERYQREVVAYDVTEKQFPQKPKDEYDVNGLVLLRSTLVDSNTSSGLEITGDVVNRRGHVVRYVEIRFAMYDADGAKIGTAWTNVTNLGPGETWRFKASGFKPCHHYKFDELIGR